MAPKKSSKTGTISREPEDGESNAWSNSKTCRPKRKRASPADSPFVDSAVAVSDPESDFTDTSGDEELVQVPRKRRALNSRILSPPQDTQSEHSDINSEQAFSACQSDEEPYAQNEDTVRGLIEPGALAEGDPVSFTISNLVVNVPAGHKGPILLQLDLPPASRAQKSQIMQRRHSKPLHSPEQHRWYRVDSRSTSKDHAGFLDLPAELRNDIYERVFVANKSLHFRYPSNFQLSAAFLRTCRQVYEEGRSLLYGGNKFILERRTARSGSYWEAEWSEAGFKPVKRLLKMIGPTNTALLRHVGIHCEDAMPCLNPDLHTADERRFTRDEVLMSCLRHLARHAQLQTLELNFNGKP